MAGYRGLLAPWIGGASSAPEAADAGFKGLLAPWIGGAASPSADNSGYRSLLAFWAGGACNAGSIPPTPDIPVGGIWMPLPTAINRAYRRRYIDDDAVLLMLASGRNQTYH